MSASLDEEGDGAASAAAAEDASQFDTDRSGVDELLESMFTERTAENNDEEDEVELPEEENGGDESPTDCDTSDCHRESDDADAEGQLADTVEQDVEDGLLEIYGDGSTTPTLSGRTRRNTIEQRVAEVVNPPSPEHSALRVIAFDVGGKLFRCKESLIRKHPHKRLNQVISCGCERLGHDTYFIDRNPQNFEVILDWYRTGMYVRHPHVDENALQEDAKYFDLYQELFPDKILPAPRVDRTAPPNDSSDAVQQQQPPRVPPRPHRHRQQPATGAANAKYSDSPTIDQASVTNSHTPGTQVSPTTVSAHRTTSDKAAGAPTTTGVLHYCRTEHRSVVVGGVPVVYMVRENERLLVASVAGRGKLLVRVCDATGMQVVFVETAVLFDSQSWFYLQGGRAKLEHCLLPGNHTYTFWMEASEQTIRSINSDASKSNRGVASGLSTHHKNEKPELEIEFKIVSSFRVDEQCPNLLDDELRSLACNKNVAEVFQGSGALSTRESASPATFSPFMFLPPRLQKQQQHETEGQQVEAAPSDHDSRLRSPRVVTSKRTDFDLTKQMKVRDTIAKQIFAQSSSNQTRSVPAVSLSVSAVGKTSNKTKGTNNNIPNSVIKRGGAAVVSGSVSVKISSNNNNSSNTSKLGAGGTTQAGRITIYRAAQLKIEDSPRGSPRSASRSTLDKRQDTTPSRIAAQCRDHQPRLFR